VRQAKQAFDAYKIDGVPTLGIHGRWFTSGSLTGSAERALAVADHLIQRARKPA
jgi:thiol:disulfide interchange protein DsbA